MSGKYGMIITDAGTALIAEHILSGTTIGISTVKVGDGGGAQYTPRASQTDLVNTCWSGAPQSAAISETQPNVIDIQILIPASAAGFTAREVGIFTTDGVMIAVGNVPDTVKTDDSDGVSSVLSMLIHLAVADAGVLEFVIASPEDGYYTPEQFGAKGDGETDDTAAILAAIAAAGEGGEVRLKRDAEYLVTDTLELKDGQTFDGCGARMIWDAPAEMDGGVIVSAPRIMTAAGSLRREIPITEKPMCIGNASSSSYGSANKRGFTYIKVGEDPAAVYGDGLNVGDRIIIQAARNALAPESGEYWAGTPTGSADPSYWAEVLVVNDVEKTGASEWTVQCIGTLTYPYYLPGREEGVDISVPLTDVCLPKASDPTKLSVVGYYVRDEDADKYLVRKYNGAAASTIRKVDFLQKIRICNLNILAKGKAHSGDTSGPDADSWKGLNYANTIVLTLCEGAVIENVHIRAKDMGRGFAMINCWFSKYKNSSYEADYRIYAVAETHTFTNAFTFGSTWSCSAEGCETVRAGQSFDTSYGGDVRCPALYTAVRGCTVKESMDSAATNHSGGWGELFEGCRFINCARPLAIRAPMTTVKNCTFAGQSGTQEPPQIAGTAATVGDLPESGVPEGAVYYVESEDLNYRWTGEEWIPQPISEYRYNYDQFHISFAEPTARGCIVEGCSFFGGKAIQIAPYLLRFFNYETYADDGNYFTKQSYVAPGADARRPNGYIVPVESDANPYPPSRRSLGIQMRGNVFSGCQNVLWSARPVKWLTDSDGNITEYAKQDAGIDFRGNTIVDCGAHLYPFYIEPYSNGVEISGNRFIRCMAEDPAYYTEDGTAKNISELIHLGADIVRAVIKENRAEECGGAFMYLYNKPAAVTEDLGTNGSPQLTAVGNMLDNRSGRTNMAIAATDNDTETEYTQVGKTTADRMVDSIDSTEGGFSRAIGHRYDFAEQRLDWVVGGLARAAVDSEALYSNQPEANEAACLLRGWCYINANEATKAMWRVAIYDDYVSEDAFRKICECWDAGEDAAGNSVTFASSIVIDEGYDSADPETGKTVHMQKLVTYGAPLNSALTFVAYGARYIGSNAMYSVDSNTGFMTVNVPAVSAPSERSACSAFSTLPTGFTPVTGGRYYVFCEVRENNTGGGIRINSLSDADPSCFSEKMATTWRGDVEAPEYGLGDISAWAFRYNQPARLDLGRSSAPWKMVYSDDITVGGKPLINYIYPTPTATGDPAVFDDGADQRPVSHLIAAVPVAQQGSGTPAPDNWRGFIKKTGTTITRTDGDGNNSQTYTVSLGTDVYGGTFDAATGVLTLTHRFVEFDGTETWYKAAGEDDDHNCFYTAIDGEKTIVDASETPKYSLLENALINQSTTTQGGRVYNGTNWTRFSCRFTGYTALTKEEFADFVGTLKTGGTPLQTVFKLLNPVTVQFTPVEVTTLLGGNKISSDLGEVAVTYKADPYLYYEL